MMRYLQRQRRSVISSTGFKRLFGLLLGAIIFLASAIPLHIEDNLLTMPELRMQTEKLSAIED